MNFKEVLDFCDASEARLRRSQGDEMIDDVIEMQKLRIKEMLGESPEALVASFTMVAELIYRHTDQLGVRTGPIIFDLTTLVIAAKRLMNGDHNVITSEERDELHLGIVRRLVEGAFGDG